MFNTKSSFVLTFIAKYVRAGGNLDTFRVIFSDEVSDVPFYYISGELGANTPLAQLVLEADRVSLYSWRMSTEL